MPETGTSGPASYVAPSIRDYGDLVELTATIGGGLSDVPQGTPTRHRAVRRRRTASPIESDRRGSAIAARAALSCCSCSSAHPENWMCATGTAPSGRWAHWPPYSDGYGLSPGRRRVLGEEARRVVRSCRARSSRSAAPPRPSRARSGGSPRAAMFSRGSSRRPSAFRDRRRGGQRAIRPLGREGEDAGARVRDGHRQSVVDAAGLELGREHRPGHQRQARGRGAPSGVGAGPARGRVVAGAARHALYRPAPGGVPAVGQLAHLPELP